MEERPPSEIYEIADADLHGDRFQLAIDRFRTIKNRYSLSSYAPLAQLRLGDAYYLQESYIEAAASYEVFIELHPKHPAADYAFFMMCESHLLDSPSSLSRDQSSAMRAIELLEQFSSRYPKSPFRGLVIDRINAVRGRLGQKEIAIGDHYLQWDHYESAYERYRYVTQHLADTSAASSALSRAKTLLEAHPFQSARQLEEQSNAP